MKTISSNIVKLGGGIVKEKDGIILKIRNGRRQLYGTWLGNTQTSLTHRHSPTKSFRRYHNDEFERKSW